MKGGNLAIPLQLQDGIWKRYLETMRAVKFNCARKSHHPLMGTKEAATEHDKKGVIAVCMWSGTLNNAEFMNFFQSMVSNCGRGSEIAISKYKDLSMTDIKEDNGLEFQTFKQYVMRVKTLGEIFNYARVTYKIFREL